MSAAPEQRNDAARVKSETDCTIINGKGGGVSTSSGTTCTHAHRPSKPHETKGSACATPKTHVCTRAHATTTEDAPGNPVAGSTVSDYAEAKRLRIGLLRNLGLADITYLRNPAIRIPYFDVNGQEAAVRFQLALDGPDMFRWRKGSKTLLYGLWRLAGAEKTSIIICKGECDCHTLWQHGIPALGLPGTGNWKEDRDTPHLVGFETIYIVVEHDQGGKTVQKWLAKSSIRDRVSLVNLGDHKDPSGLYLADPERFPERLNAAIREAVSWTEIEAETKQIQAIAAWETCRTLAESANILEQFIKELNRQGVVGEGRNAQILYLALTSRRLDRPVSVAVKGPSSGGKSHITEKVLEFFPDSAYYALSSMSEKALAYSEEPLSHRFLVIYEAAGMGSDLATYLMRSLLSEGRIRYETVEKTKDGIKPRLIEREGPTGLLITTTAHSLHPENETRLLSLSVTDSREQTQRVLLALARNHGIQAIPPEWHGLQTWLEHAQHQVLIPYAEALAEKIPPVAVRLRRDFRALLTLIESHAILHQASREREADGRIIATVEDYAAVRALVLDLMSEGVEATVSATIRETVEAVRTLLATGGAETVEIHQIAAKLKLEKSSASRRVKGAVAKGYLVNRQEKKRQPAKIAIGAPMPEDLLILPLPSDLEISVHVCNGVQMAMHTLNVDVEPIDDTVCRCAIEIGEDYTPSPPSCHENEMVEITI
jgi:hypothetical protein